MSGALTCSASGNRIFGGRGRGFQAEREGQSLVVAFWDGAAPVTIDDGGVVQCAASPFSSMRPAG
jgi:hypothetical protein